MASVYELKPRFQSLLRPIVNRLARAGVRPNAITLAALAGSLIAGILVSRASADSPVLLVLPAWLILRMALNAIDGMLAREHDMKTALGGILNEVSDVVSDICLYLPLGFLTPSAMWPAIAFCFGAALTEFCGVLSLSVDGQRRYEGPMGKSDRAALIGLLALVTYFVPSIVFEWGSVLTLGAVLTLVTCMNRIAKSLRARGRQ